MQLHQSATKGQRWLGVDTDSALSLYETCKVRTIKAGTLERLVEYMVSAFRGKDSTYVTIFLCTYRSFATTKQVLDLLLNRYVGRRPRVSASAPGPSYQSRRLFQVRQAPERACSRGPQSLTGRQHRAEEVSTEPAWSDRGGGSRAPVLTSCRSPLQHRLLHPGRVAGPVLGGLLEPSQLRLSAPAAVLPAPPLPRLGPGASRPQPAGPLPPATAV